MNIFYAILLGFIQGVTEFLPVSSSGHLAIAQILFNIEEADLLFDVLLHVGTLLAIFIVFYKDILRLIIAGFSAVGCACYNLYVLVSNLFRKEEKLEYKVVFSNGYRKFAILIVVSCIPTAIIGFLDRHIVEELSKILIVPGICLIITGGILLLAQYLGGGDKRPKETTFIDALIVGVAQGVATLPGLSRSGATLSAGLLCGFERKYAVKYSFILSIPAVLGSLILELKDVDFTLVSSEYIICSVVGMTVAALVGFVCIKVMLLVVRRNSFIGFSIYCFALGLISIVVWFVMK